jgi:hypothetical protein
MPYKRTGQPTGRRRKPPIQEFKITGSKGEGIEYRRNVPKWWIQLAHFEVTWALGDKEHKYRRGWQKEAAREFEKEKQPGQPYPPIPSPGTLTKARKDPRFIRLRDSLMKSALQVLERERNESPKQRAERIDRDAKTDAALRASLAIAFDAAHRRR